MRRLRRREIFSFFSWRLSLLFTPHDCCSSCRCLRFDGDSIVVVVVVAAVNLKHVFRAQRNVQQKCDALQIAHMKMSIPYLSRILHQKFTVQTNIRMNLLCSDRTLNPFTLLKIQEFNLSHNTRIRVGATIARTHSIIQKKRWKNERARSLCSFDRQT